MLCMTGGTGALGSCVADHLVKSGASVILLGRSIDKLRSKCDELNTDKASNAFFYVVDVTDEESLKETRDTIASEFKHLDGLVNMAGGHISGAIVRPDQGHGSIVNISSMAAKQSISRALVRI